MVALGLILGGLLYSAQTKGYVSIQIGLVCVAVFILEILTGVNFGGVYVSTVTLELGLSHGPQFAPFQPLHPWEPFGALTSIYVHEETFHLFYNLIALVVFGIMLEDRVGAFRFAVAFYATGALGGLGFLLLHFGDPFILVGASSAVSGVFGVFARLYPRLRISLWFLPIALPVYLLFILNLLVQFLLALVSTSTALLGAVAFEAHIVAAAGGFALGPLFAKRTAAGAPRRPLLARALGVEELRPLAMTPELRQILQTVEKETVPEVREAWISRFRERARCPQCGDALRWARGDASSACGWRLRKG